MIGALWQAIVEPFQFAFMVKALGVGILVGIVCAVLSCFITLKGWSLMGDAVSHSVLPGVILAYLIGAPFGIGAFIFGLAAVLLIGWVSARSRLRDDAIIGIVFTAFFGVGLILVSKLPDLGDWAAATFGYRPPLLDVRGILFGNVLGISDADIVQTIITGGVTLLIVLLFRKDLILFCFDPNHARAIGLNTSLLHYTLLALLALSTVAALQTIGIVLVVAMLITPGAIAYMLTDRFGRMLALAVSASVASCIIGIYVSYYLHASTGGCIVLTQALIFLIVLLVAPKRGLLARLWTRRQRADGALIRQPGAA